MTTLKSSIETDVCIVGGGPAGCTLAHRLAQLGYSTLLVHRSANAKHVRAESLAPSIMPILCSPELRSVVDSSVFLTERRAFLLWGAGVVEEKHFPSTPSLLIDRNLFDDRLRAAAHRAGAQLMEPATARTPERLRSGGWIVPVTTPDGSTLVKSKFLVDSRGKRHGTLVKVAPRTAAISAAWMLEGRAFDETRIEAGRDEWFWGSPLPDGSYAATIFLDSGRLSGLTQAGRTAFYRGVLATSHLLGHLLRGEMTTPPWVRDATSGINKDLIGVDFVRVGEAAASIDPLSSQGIQTAFLSAIQGSAAVHTLLTEGHAALHAIEFYRERQEHVVKRAGENAMMLYRAGARHNDSSFWHRRSHPGEGIPVRMRQEPMMPVPPSGRLRLSAAAQIIDAPVLSGSSIARAPALSHPALDRPIVYVGRHAVVSLLSEAAEASAEQILQRWSKWVPKETAWNILTWMCAVGILVPYIGDSRDQFDRRAARPNQTRRRCIKRRHPLRSMLPSNI
jgi:flavin-dependent dehydrogenase